jgi:PAS domain-containing protein
MAGEDLSSNQGASLRWEAEALAQLPVGIAEVNEEGRLVRANAAMGRLLGLPDNQLIGFDLRALRWPQLSGSGSQTVLDAAVSGHPLGGIFTVVFRTDSWSR